MVLIAQKDRADRENDKFRDATNGTTAIAVVSPDGSNIAGSTLSTSLKNGQAKIAVTGTAVQLGTNSLPNGLIIAAKSTNTSPILIGNSNVTNVSDGTGNGFILEAGAATSYACDNSNEVWINGTAGDIISFSGS